jgi:tRNA pseudouridine(38-40) synthase
MDAALTASMAATRGFKHPGDSKYNQRVAKKRAAVDKLFTARDEFNNASGDAERANRSADGESADRAGLFGRRQSQHVQSRQVTFLDPEPADAESLPVQQAQDALAAATRANDDVTLPSDDPSYSVLTDDAFTYFPEDDTARQHELAAAVPGANVVPPGMRRFRMELQFRGDHFLGWNRAAEMRNRRKALAVKRGELTPAAAMGEAENVTWAGHALGGLRSVKDAVEEALSVALDTTKVEVVTSVALETGAHARRLTCHVDIPADIEMQPRTVLLRAHAWLRQKNDPLGILTFQRAPPDFHARHSATRRVYLYRILNRIAPPLFDVGHHWHVDRYLDEEKMNVVAQELLLGRHDFGFFADSKIARAVREGGSMATVRAVDEIRVVRQEDEVLVWVVGKSFLRHSIRNMVGALRFVGQGHWTRENVRTAMERGFDSRTVAPRFRPPTAPAQGLTLWDVQFPAAMGVTPAFVDSGPLEVDAMLVNDQAATGAVEGSIR